MRTAWVAATVMLMISGGERASAQSAWPASSEAVSDALSASAQAASRPAVRRALARITITPRKRSASPYPSPYTYRYPGPGAVRECTSWLEQDVRPSGTVIVPRMRCWWARS